MKNKLTIYNADGTISEYRDVEHFQTLENGVSLFEFGHGTQRMGGEPSRNITESIPLGTKVKFKCDFSYEDYSDTKAGKF